MALDYRCIQCFEKSFTRLVNKYSLSKSNEAVFAVYFRQVLEKNTDLTTPEIQRLLQHKLRQLTGIKDPFEEEKLAGNNTALRLYDFWKPEVLQSNDPFRLALKLAIAGNIMDYAADFDFNINETIGQVLKSRFAINHSKLLKKKIQQAQRILYLGDNAGEIVFDKLFIEIMMHPEVTYAVRGGPAINDATLDDALMIGMCEVADVVSNGFDAASTIIDKCSENFRTKFDNADLIISKGQGNLEGLIGDNDPRIFFLLMVKCDVIADTLKVKKGSIVVLNNEKHHGKY